MLSFDLHNLHLYSEEQVKAKRGFARYTATIGVLTMDNTLISRAVVEERISNGGRPGRSRGRRRRSWRRQGGRADGNRVDCDPNPRGRRAGELARRKADGRFESMARPRTRKPAGRLRRAATSRSSTNRHRRRGRKPGSQRRRDQKGSETASDPSSRRSERGRQHPSAIWEMSMRTFLSLAFMLLPVLAFAQVKRTNPPALSKPTGYTHVVEFNGPGKTIYIAGQIALDKDGRRRRRRQHEGAGGAGVQEPAGGARGGGGEVLGRREDEHLHHRHGPRRRRCGRSARATSARRRRRARSSRSCAWRGPSSCWKSK